MQSSTAPVAAVRPHLLTELGGSRGLFDREETKQSKNKQSNASAIMAHFRSHCKIRVQQKVGCFVIDMVLISQLGVALVLTVLTDSTDCPWLPAHEYCCYMHAAILPTPPSSFPLAFPSAVQKTCLLPADFSHPLRRWEGRGIGYFLVLSIPPNWLCFAASFSCNCWDYYHCIFYTYACIYTHVCFLYIYIYIYIFFSLPVQLRDTTRIYLCNEKREIGRSKGIFL